MPNVLTLVTVSAMALACGSTPATHVAPTTVAAPQPVAMPTPNETVHSIEVGQVFQGTLHGDGNVCIFVIDGSEEGPCDRFTVVAPQSGTLTVHVAWDNSAHFLGITVPRGLSFPGIRCCTSPTEFRLSVTAGQTTELYVYFAGATDGPGGHVPASAQQSYDLVTSLQGK
jgi:hypothetical protein